MSNTLTDKYAPVVNKLAEIYLGHEVICEYADQPVDELKHYIATIANIPKEPQFNYDLAIRMFIKDLKCFKWRFVNKSNAGDVWNPFFESYEHFKKRVDNEVTFWFDDSPFPSDEIIENWVKSHVGQSEKNIKTKKHNP